MPKYLYNGVELPALPDWDKTIFPYAYIWTIDSMFPGSTPSNYKLTIRQAPLRYGTVDGSQSIYGDAGTTAMYNCNLTDGEFKTWEYYGENVSDKSNSADPIWTNHNVYSDTDGTLYLAASEPVPVEEETNCTYYLYNEFPAPKLPEWNKTLYPYAYLDYYYHFGRPEIFLYYSAYPFTYDASSKKMVAGGLYYSTDYDFYQTGELQKMFYHEWSEVEESDAMFDPGCHHVLWASIDIKTNTGATFVAASEPVLWEHVESDPMGINRHTAFTLGKIMGRKIASRNRMIALTTETPIPEPPIPEGPTAYCLYNGVKLPNIDTVWTDKETYPYVTVLGSGDYYGLCISTVKGVKGDKYIESSKDGAMIQYNLADGKWSLLADRTEVPAGSMFATPEMLVWSNHDILNSDGTTYLAASDPVPVYE